MPARKMKPDITKPEIPILAFESAAGWERWLSAQPRSAQAGTPPGVWLKLAKKQSGIPSISRQEAVDGALCHGWIDGQLQKFDENYWLVRFTPRALRSRWSEVNRNRVQELADAGRVSAAGMKEVDRAKADGRWQAAYPSQGKAAVPEDLQAALNRNPKAKRLFSKLDRVNRYAILHRLHNTQRPDTRANKIAKYVEMLARGKTIYPLKGQKSENNHAANFVGFGS